MYIGAWYSNFMRKTTSGFTIVELLIVIVVIAILAAISTVAYNGIQQRAKTSAAESIASNVAKKAELYNTEVGNYPLAASSLTGAPLSASYSVTGIMVGGLENYSSTNTVGYYICGTGNPASLAAITASNASGGQVYYRNYATSSNLFISFGVSSGTGVACFPSYS